MAVAFFFFALWVASGFIAAAVATAKGWNGANWFWAGFLFGPAGLLGAAGMPDKYLRKDQTP